MTDIKAFHERWQRMEEARQATRDDLKELFSEAKAEGFNAKAMRKVFAETMEPEDKRQKRDADDVDAELYRTALGRARVASAMPTRQITHQPIVSVEKKTKKPVAEVLPPSRSNGAKASWLDMLPVKA